MKRELPPAAIAAIVALVVVLAAGIGWHFVNQEPEPVAKRTMSTPYNPGGASAGNPVKSGGGQMSRPSVD